MHFKGTIIITDPCYVVKDIEEVVKEKGIELPKYPNISPKASFKELEEYNKKVREARSYIQKYDDWRRCYCGEDMGILGFTKYISESTIYGDWSCTTYKINNNNVVKAVEELSNLNSEYYKLCRAHGENSDKAKEYLEELNRKYKEPENIGKFCADSGMVGVFLLDEVLKYNPNFDKWIERHNWCITVIDDFEGNVNYYVDSSNQAHIIGVGNINFFTTQTGI